MWEPLASRLPSPAAGGGHRGAEPSALVLTKHAEAVARNSTVFTEPSPLGPRVCLEAGLRLTQAPARGGAGWAGLCARRLQTPSDRPFGLIVSTGSRTHPSGQATFLGDTPPKRGPAAPVIDSDWIPHFLPLCPHFGVPLTRRPLHVLPSIAGQAVGSHTRCPATPTSCFSARGSLPLPPSRRPRESKQVQLLGGRAMHPSPRPVFRATPALRGAPGTPPVTPTAEGRLQQ